MTGTQTDTHSLQSQSQDMVSLPEIRHHGTQWDPRTMQVTLNARLDAKLIPQGISMRLNYSHVVVIDNFIGEAEREGLLDFMTEPDWDHESGPPDDKWERETADGPDMPKTWGLKDSVLQELAKGDLPAMQEVHARLAKIYPEYIISHMPSNTIQQPPPSHDFESESLENYCCMSEWDEFERRMSHEMKAREQGSSETPAAAAAAGKSSSSNQHMQEESTPSVDCNQFVGNAAVYGDDYSWHVDADPSAFPPSPWTDAFGHYCNGEPGKLYTL